MAGRVSVVTNAAQFDAELTEHACVAVDFGAEWCGPCKSLQPVFQALAQEPRFAAVRFLSVDVDANEDIHERFQRYPLANQVPFFLFFYRGRLLEAFGCAGVRERISNSLLALVALHSTHQTQQQPAPGDATTAIVQNYVPVARAAALVAGYMAETQVDRQAGEFGWKMYLVVNTTLAMDKGKLLVQACHGAVAWTRRLEREPKRNAAYEQWLLNGEPKIALKADEATMIALRRKYPDITEAVVDCGKTQVAAGSFTVLAFAPLALAHVPPELGRLKLL